MQVQSIRIGGWFQRTFIHLNEIRQFVQTGGSEVAGLDNEKLSEFHRTINPQNIHYHEGALDYLTFCSGAIKVVAYEDGLLSLKLDGEGVMVTQSDLTDFYETKLSVALNYLFSTGAPVPKELAGIKTIYPYFITVSNATQDDVKKIFSNYNEKIISDFERDGVQMYRGVKVNVINLTNDVDKTADQVQEFIDQQIFARDFEIQLKHYLNLHREVWDLIAEIKERGKIKGYEVKGLKERIDGYAKVINLIDTRLDQMDSYLKTRESVVLRHQGDGELYQSLHFKYESLRSTLDYVNDLWSMTKNYVASAQDLFKDLQDKATESSLKNLTVVTTIGVFASLSKVLSSEGYEYTWFGLLLLICFIVVGLSSSKLLKIISARRTYKIKNVKSQFEE